jgi:hypothetical protein
LVVLGKSELVALPLVFEHFLALNVQNGLALFKGGLKLCALL